MKILITENTAYRYEEEMTEYRKTDTYKNFLAKQRKKAEAKAKAGAKPKVKVGLLV